VTQCVYTSLISRSTVLEVERKRLDSFRAEIPSGDPHAGDYANHIL
jgi:hypothetical protein